MVSNLSKTENKSNMELTFDEDNKINMLPGSFSDNCQYINVATHEPTTMMKSEVVNDATLFDEWLTDDLEKFQEENIIFETPPLSYDVSPIMSSSMATPQEIIESPLFKQVPSSFSTSPHLDSTLGFFPDLSDENDNTKSLMQLNNIAPSVTIPADDSSLYIPWGSDANNVSDIDVRNIAVLIGTPSLQSVDFNNVIDGTIDPPAVTAPTKTTTVVSRSRKRSSSEFEKGPEVHSEELAIKRAKNTDAARRSRLRKVKKMESLEKQVSEFKTENNELQTRIAVLESEKKGLEEKNGEKDSRIRMLEQQLAEAHERLINRS
ncbi:9046_t:CDS:1 [Diversispora eburnea]|uniref:9046_t:CDS:1 n=1 Tax=Diversispora eburnea TaxID=1213867 RepID=A0A9N9F7G2_9GLOM|nr:9046_t:CDS:1 [Diversispora eburnea]